MHAESAAIKSGVIIVIIMKLLIFRAAHNIFIGVYLRSSAVPLLQAIGEYNLIL